MGASTDTRPPYFGHETARVETCSPQSEQRTKLILSPAEVLNYVENVSSTGAIGHGFPATNERTPAVCNSRSMRGNVVGVSKPREYGYRHRADPEVDAHIRRRSAC